MDAVLFWDWTRGSSAEGPRIIECFLFFSFGQLIIILGKCLLCCCCCFGAGPVSQSPVGGAGGAGERRSVIRKRHALPEEGLGSSLLSAPLLEELAH